MELTLNYVLLTIYIYIYTLSMFESNVLVCLYINTHISVYIYMTFDLHMGTVATLTSLNNVPLLTLCH